MSAEDTQQENNDEGYFFKYAPLYQFYIFCTYNRVHDVYHEPVCLAVSFLCALVTALYLNGKKAVRLSLVFLLPMILLIVLVNPVFNHEGMTILTYFPWDNPLTLESIVYGIASAFLLSSTVLWFSSFNAVITSDKVVFLFGRIMPSLSLVISMALRFVPRFSAQMKLVRNAQHTIGRDIDEGSLFQRIRNACKNPFDYDNMVT